MVLVPCKLVASNLFEPNFDVLSATELIFTNDSDDGVRILESQVIVSLVENWFTDTKSKCDPVFHNFS